jgi:hypothetical protein
VLLFLELIIALYVKDEIIRPYGGDFLVVIFIYCFCRSFLVYPSNPLLFAVLLFAYGVEFSQYFNLIQSLGLSQNRLAQWVLGSSFSWLDMLAYTAGVVLIWIIENKTGRKPSKFENVNQ